MAGCDALVTGVSGFIGGGLAKFLVGSGQAVLGVGCTAPRQPHPDVRYAPLDVTDARAVSDLLATEQPTVVYHLAALSVLQGAADDPTVMLETNVRGTWNVLEAARRAGVRAVVVASSDKQYGALAVPPYQDSDTTAFLNGGLYELSKAQQDQVARLYAGLYDLPAVRVARLANIYGPGDTHWSRLIPGTIRRTLAGEAPIIRAQAGQALREYVFLEDALQALQALADDALGRGNAPYRNREGRLATVAFNVGSGQTFAAGDVIKAVQKTLRTDFGVAGPKPVVVPSEPAAFEPGSQFNDGAKLRSLAPYYAPRSLPVGLRATIPWYLDHLARAARAAPP